MAPVTAVLGNTDYDLELKDREWVEVGTRRILVHHIVDLPVPEVAGHLYPASTP